MRQLTTMPAFDDALITSGLTELAALRSRTPVPSLDPGELFYQRDRYAPPDRLVLIQADPPRWSLFADVERKLNALLRLSAGWDGRRAESITVAAAGAAVQVIGELTTSTSVFPQLFPLSDGGITIGWRVAGDEIEIEVDARGESIVLAVTADERTVAEGALDPVEPDGTLLATRQFLARMSARLAS